MQFILAATATFWWPMFVRVPDPAQAGAITEQELKVQLIWIDEDEQLAREAAVLKIQDVQEQVKASRELIADRVTGWDGVVDGKGEPVPFSREALLQALKQSWFKAGLIRAVKEASAGEAARLGN